ncbi:hypothetical protein [Photobacterium piscicola]|uniref:hypothetical protein n=1 Tax=Photobacterium piscicola TaxID=1378299 RepID=UPI0038D0A1C3
MNTTPTIQIDLVNAEIEIRWKREINSAECLAIMYAVNHGYNTREELIRVLPQFSQNRIQSALAILFAYQLVTQQMELLILSLDAILIDHITMAPNMVLPLDVGIELGNLPISFQLDVLQKLGIENQGIALSTVFFRASNAAVANIASEEE